MTEVTVFYDYVCPYVYRAAEWMNSLDQILDTPPTVEWRAFSLTQVNHRIRDNWKVWEEPANGAAWENQDYARALRLFWAAGAGLRQGKEAFRNLHIELLRAIHADRQEINTRDSVVEIADKAGLEMSQFDRDLDDTSCLEHLAADHTAGVALGVFGTPTYVIGSAAPAYLKLTRPLNTQESLELWHSFSTVVAEQPFVAEIKRPQ